MSGSHISLAAEVDDGSGGFDITFLIAVDLNESTTVETYVTLTAEAAASLAMNLTDRLRLP